MQPPPERKQAKKSLELVSSLLSIHPNEEFFDNIARELALNIDVRIVLIGVLDESETNLKLVGFYGGGDAPLETSWPLKDSLFSHVLQDEVLEIVEESHDIHEQFPGFEVLQDFHRGTYLGVPFRDMHDKIAGVIAIFDDQSLKNAEFARAILHVMTPRISQELERREALEEIHRLKEQQDGDYYLTSLLIAPLNRNVITDHRTRVLSLLKQKKTFDFRRWKNQELGGDMCNAQTIHLSGRSYTVFINADAMGKSMQGAGGVLVLGSIFETIITRTKNSTEMSDSPPEIWMSTVFREFNEVFRTFDHSMLVSMVMGLIDNETGLLYYVNAEHPWLTLYRNNRAIFLEEQLMFRKLGSIMDDDEFYVKTFQLQQGDILFCGSDGRDDLLLEENTGGRKINENVYEFLERVNESAGDLFGLYQSILQKGELTDDLSLLRITYREEESYEEFLNQKAQEEQVINKIQTELKNDNLKQAVKILNQTRYFSAVSKALACKHILHYNREKGLFKESVYLARELINLSPADTDSLFLASYVLKMAGKYREAATAGERVYFRDPNHFNNLLNLSNAHQLCTNWKLAEKYLNRAKTLNPDHPQFLKLEKIVMVNHEV